MKNIVHNIWYIFSRELHAIFRDEAVLTFFVALTLAYPLVYTYIYSNEAVHEVPVAVVDNSRSSVSREFIRGWDAASGVDVVAVCSDMEEAKLLLYRKEIYGILEVPGEFAGELAKGKQGHISLYCDMGGLLNYKALLQAASDVAVLMGKKIQVEGLEFASSRHQEMVASPVKMTEVRMFNPQSGYATFIIPAILILVIQQSLLLGVGTLAGTARDRNKRRRLIPMNCHYKSSWQIVSGKSMAYLLIYVFVALWIFVVVPGIFNLTRIGLKWDLFLFLLPFLLGCVSFALTLSFLCREREAPFLIFVFTSVPLMFMSGISWPVTAIPDYWVAFSKIFPSTYGIEGLVKINSLGASLGDVGPEFRGLWGLSVLYFLTASWLYRREIRRQRVDSPLSFSGSQEVKNMNAK